MTDISTDEQTRRLSADPLDSQLTFDDTVMLGIAAVAAVGAVLLLVIGF